jgi:hypothetical protein
MDKKDLFALDNLVAWCIVPFDATGRGPQERAAMLKRLGLSRLAYDWRAEHIPTFDQEIEALAAHGIRLEAFWCPLGLSGAQAEQDAVLNALECRQVQTQLWTMLNENELARYEDGTARIEAAAKAIEGLARRAADIGCRLALYNHGGWFGEPENQMAIIEELGRDDVGISYNLHHAHEHLDRLDPLLTLVQPHLYCLTLNGMNRQGPKILPLGQGEDDSGLLDSIVASGYDGPIAVLDHRPELDAEESLRQNLDGLQTLLA